MSVECKNRSESDLDIDVEFSYPFRSGFVAKLIHFGDNVQVS